MKKAFLIIASCLLAIATFILAMPEKHELLISDYESIKIISVPFDLSTQFAWDAENLLKSSDDEGTNTQIIRDDEVLIKVSSILKSAQATPTEAVNDSVVDARILFIFKANTGTSTQLIVGKGTDRGLSAKITEGTQVCPSRDDFDYLLTLLPQFEHARVTALVKRYSANNRQ